MDCNYDKQIKSLQIQAKKLTDQKLVATATPFFLAWQQRIFNEKKHLNYSLWTNNPEFATGGKYVYV